MTTNETTKTPMQGFFQESVLLPNQGELIEGVVIHIDAGRVYVDLPPHSTGIIYGREYINARDLIKKLNVGDSISATIVDSENEDGYIELSIKEARQALIWGEADEIIKQKTVLDIPVKDANKGGLILEWQGIQGFIPASQLKPENYPRVEGGDKDRILEELQKLVGKVLSVTMIAVDPKEGKLIFSEKDPQKQERMEVVEKFEVGDEIEGTITGIVDFGVFIEIKEGLEGLAHISELDWGLVEDPRNLFTIGEKIRAKVIEIKEGQISLSIKALKSNPWENAQDKYAPGNEVEAVVIKFNKHGALASIEEGVAGLVHNSEFASPEELKSTLELGKKYPFKINLFEPANQRMTLTYTGEKKAV